MLERVISMFNNINRSSPWCSQGDCPNCFKGSQQLKIFVQILGIQLWTMY